MSVTNESNKISYTSSGGTSYAVPFYFQDDTHIKLYIDDVAKTISTHYTVSGEGNPSGGTLTILSAPAVGANITITREVPLKQENTFNEGGPFLAATMESMFDRLTHIGQQLNEKVSRAALIPVSSTLNPALPSGLAAGETIIINPAGTGFTRGPTAAQVSSAQTDALASAASATASAASASASAASATAAATSASVAQTAANSQLWRDVVFLTVANSPYTITSSHRSKMFSVDASGGAVTINLPLISGLDLTTAFTVGIKKSDSSGNNVIVNRSGTDTIDGFTSASLGSASSGLVLIPDIDPSPDRWTSAQFGASAGNMTVDSFSGTGAQVNFTLSVDPGSENNTSVYIHGVYQDKGTYSLSGTTLTFDAAPVAGTNNIQVISGTSLPVGTPSDGSITNPKLGTGCVTNANVSSTAAIAMSKTNFGVAYVKDVQANNTGGGTSTSAAYVQRRLSLVEDPSSIGVTLNSNQFTLPTGTYEIFALANAYYSDGHRAKLYNVSDSVDAILGSNGFSFTGLNDSMSASTTPSFVVGTITITGSKTFEVRHRVQTGRVDGFGVANNFSESEVYLVVKITRIK